MAQDLIALYRTMLLIRRFEERVAEMYTLGKIGGFCHLYNGQEAVATGALAALRADDYVLVYYRDHGHALARGVEPKRIMAELFGKSGGLSRGKGGSMHLFDTARGFFGGYAIVGEHLALATGIGLAITYRGGDQVVVCFFGDGAVNGGLFHESLNLAALWKLPVLFLCENNAYGMGTPIAAAMTRSDRLHEKAEAYGMAHGVVDGMDVLAVRDRVAEAVGRARADRAPTLLEAQTYRFVGHSMRDPAHGTYRSREELDQHRAQDPLKTFPKLLKDKGAMTDEDLAKLDREIRTIVDEAVAFAEESPVLPPEAIEEDIYA
ncbi:MAG: pyruvate dehydrogenase (acetyl-transferring) E1 component subunit alpha [Nitrospiria bacterium]